MITNKRHIVQYDNNRQNTRQYRQSYLDCIALLSPKIWEIPEVKLSPYITDLVARREIFFMSRDISDARYKAKKFTERLAYLKSKPHDSLDVGQKNELSRLSGQIKRQLEWIDELQGFQAVLKGTSV